jgi:hypothetical protein
MDFTISAAIVLEVDYSIKLNLCFQNTVGKNVLPFQLH